MNTRIHAAVVVCLFPLISCEKEKTSAEKPTQPAVDYQMKADMPLLPIKEGDWWKYKVIVNIPPGITSEGSAAVEIELEKTRSYIGKVSAGEGLPVVDAFDVSVPGEELEREFVEIYEDRILMRGSGRPNLSGSKPIWLETAIPFVTAGMRPGMEIQPFSINDGNVQRATQVVAREKVNTPAGNYPCIRLLMTGNDGKFQVRRTTWFSPGIGIVKEEKMRYAGEKLVFRETTELSDTNVGK